MSDTDQTPEQKANGETAEKQTETKQPAPKKDDGGDGYSAAFKSLQAEKSRLENDLAAMSKKLSERDKELGEHKSKLDGYIKREREGAIVAKVRAARPELEEIDIRGRLAIFAEDGKVDRYAPEDKLEEAVKAALELIPENTHSPSQQKRPAPAQGGGPNGAPQQNGRKTQGKFLI